MTSSQLKYKLEQKGSHFFNRKTMKFFGDTMVNFRLYSGEVTGRSGNTHQVWCVQRKKSTKIPMDTVYYWDKETLERVFID